MFKKRENREFLNTHTFNILKEIFSILSIHKNQYIKLYNTVALMILYHLLPLYRHHHLIIYEILIHDYADNFNK